MTVKTTPEGYLILDARLSRTGIYEYSAAEMRGMGVHIGDKIPDSAIVRIYRDGAEVFDDMALKSFALKPITIGHPSDAVSPKNVTSKMVGISGAEVVADGIHTRTTAQLMADRAIRDYKKGITQLSAGYSCTLDMTPGRTRSGEPYDGRQTKIVGNHIAMVPTGRAGTAKLGDGIAATEGQQMADVKTTVDAVAFGEIKQQNADLTVKNSELRQTNDALTKERDKLQGEIVALKDAVTTDAQIQSRIDAGVKEALNAISERNSVIDRAKKLAPAITIADADTPRAIMEAAIRTRRSDIVLDGKSDDFVSGIFSQLKPATASFTLATATSRIADTTELPSYAELQRIVRGV